MGVSGGKNEDEEIGESMKKRRRKGRGEGGAWIKTPAEEEDLKNGCGPSARKRKRGRERVKKQKGKRAENKRKKYTKNTRTPALFAVVVTGCFPVI